MFVFHLQQGRWVWRPVASLVNVLREVVVVAAAAAAAVADFAVFAAPTAILALL